METKVVQIIASYHGDGGSIAFTIEECQRTADETGKRWTVPYLLPIGNRVPQIREAAMAKLAAICSALDLAFITDTEQLHNKPFVVHVEHGTMITGIFPIVPTRPVVKFAGRGLLDRLRVWFELHSGDLHRQVWYAWRDYPDAMKLSLFAFVGLGAMLTVLSAMILVASGYGYVCR